MGIDNKIYIVVSENKAGYKAIEMVLDCEYYADQAKAFLNAMDTNKTCDKEFFVMEWDVITNTSDMADELILYTK